MLGAGPQVGDRGHDRQAVVGCEARHAHAPVVRDRKQLRDRGIATLRDRGDFHGIGLRRLLAGSFAVLEATGSPALHAATEAFR